MQVVRLGLGTFVWLVAAALSGCAEGVVPSAKPDAAPPPDAGRDAAGPTDSATEAGGGDDADAGDAGQPDASPADAAAPDATVDAGGCPAPNTCEMATAMPSVPGDTGATARTATGEGERWLRVEVKDTGFEFNGDSTLKLRVELDVPDGSNYDLVVTHADPGGHATAPTDCTKERGRSENGAGQDESVSLSWPDRNNLPGQEAGDGLVVSIHVIHVDGPCAPWTLTVTGNS